MTRRSRWLSWINRLFVNSRPARRREAHNRIDVLEPRTLLSSITVTTLADNLNPDGQVTLREALLAANTNASVDGSTAGDAAGQDEIVFAPGLVGTVQLNPSLGRLRILESVKIQGHGAEQTSIDALSNSQVFYVDGNAGDVTFDSLTITGGRGAFNPGGGIYSLSHGTVTITNSRLSQNLTEANNSPGGALYAFHDLVIENSTFENNRTEGPLSPGGAIAAYGAVTIRNSVITGNSTDSVNSSGGGIYNQSIAAMTISDSVISENSVGGTYSHGAGIMAGGNALTITNSTIADNTNRSNGGQGGGIWVGREFTLLNSTVSGNRTTGTDGSGGGIFSIFGTAQITNSTISGNSTSGRDAHGGGIASGPLTFTNSTFLNNSVSGIRSDGGGIFLWNGDLSLINSIVARNTTALGIGPDIDFRNQAGDGTITAQSTFIGINETTPFVPMPFGVPDANGNLVGTRTNPIDPRLGPLANNGGPTKTHIPLFNSTVIDAGNTSLALDPDGNPLVTDQRGPGFPRVFGGSVDMGAVEYTLPDTDNPAPREATLEGYYYDQNGQLAELLRAGDTVSVITNVGGPGQPHVVTTDWNSLGATFDSLTGRLTFLNGDVWTKVRTLNGTWLNGQSDDVGIRQLGIDLTFINRVGQTSAGYFVDPTHFVATDWGNLLGTLILDGRRIIWSNGTVWNFIPELEGNWTNPANAPTRIEQSGSQLLFVNRVGQTSTGRFNGSGEVLALDWGQTGTLNGNVLTWSNGTTWTLFDDSDQFKELAGAWDSSGQTTQVLQRDGELTFVNRMGGTSTGRFVSASQVVADQWGVTGQLVGDQIVWSNRSSWTALPDLEGPHVDSAGRETRVAQLDRSLTLFGPQGQITHGTIVGTTTVTETDGLHRQATLINSALVWSTSDTWSPIPDLRGNWQDALTCNPTLIEQSGISILFYTDTGETLRGSFLTRNLIQTAPWGPSNTPLLVTPNPPATTVTFSNGWLWQEPPASALDAMFADPRDWPLV